MTTWSFKSLTAGAVCLALAGCNDVALLAENNSEVENVTPTVSALTSATLAQGSVALVPPTGYCVDEISLRDNFALIARCDRLGGTTAFGVPVAVITAATVGENSLSSKLGRVFATDNETILARRQKDNFTLVHVKGAPPSDDLRDNFWRGVAQIDDNVLGVAIYQTKGGAALGEQAPDLLTQTLQRTITQTTAKSADDQDNSATKDAKPVTN